MRYRFADFVLDTSSYSLSQAGRPIQLRPKVFDLLRYLIEQRERVVSKQELLEALWPAQHADEFGVPWTVSHLRRGLGQQRGAQTPIQTSHGRGYQFVAEVSVLDTSAADVSDAAQHTRASRRAESDPFVGRGPLMEQLEGRLLRAQAGNGSFCLLSGEAGIGKTRCLDELSARAETAGFSVWAGRSVEAVCGPVFWPWMQILRALAADRPDLSDAAEAILARLMAATEPLAGPAGEGVAASPGDANTDRFWQYEAIGRLLQRAGSQRPVMLSFDDLHWADTGTWELISFLAPELRSWAVLIIGARRDELRGSTQRQRNQDVRAAERFKLSKLSVADVQRYLELVTGEDPRDPALGETLHALSAGNPWFLRETVEELIAEHGSRALLELAPKVVRPATAASERLESRLAELSAQERDVLELASVLGDRFEIEILTRMEDASIEQVLRALETARVEGLVSFEPPQHARFAHGVVRQILYEQLSAERRLRLHERAARTLEATASPLRYAEIAYHYHCALPIVDLGDAAAAALRAAASASRALALGDAATFLEWAAQAQANDARVSVRDRAELLFWRAQLERAAGREALSRASASEGIEIARAHGHFDLLIEGARALRVTFALGCMPDSVALSALEEALARLPEGPNEARISALSLLSWLPPHALDMERSKTLSAEAVALARRVSSATPMRDALHARLYALSGPDDIDALLAAARALLEVPGGSPAWVAVEAYLASYRAHLYRCDLAGADAALHALGRHATEWGLSEVVWHHDFFRAQRLFSRGAFDLSEKLFDELALRGVRLGLTQAPILSAVAKALLTNDRADMSAIEQGQSLDGLLAGLIALPPCYAATGARVAAECGRSELARQLLFQLSEQDFKAVVKDLGYVNALCNLSVVCVVLQDRTRAAALYERLLPYPHHNTPSGVVGFYEGSASRFLAALAAFLGQPLRAAQHFDDALALNERLGAEPLLARTSYEYASFLFAQGEDARARLLQARAHELAQRLGMRGLAARTERLGSST